MILNPEFINTVQKWPDSVIISEWSALNVRSKVHLYLDDYATLIYCERVRRKLDIKEYNNAISDSSPRDGFNMVGVHNMGDLRLH